MDTAQQPPKLHRGMSRSRPSLANSALLDNILIENDSVINYIPLTPHRKVLVDPYEQLGIVVGGDGFVDISLDGATAEEGIRGNKSSLERIPSFPFIGLGDMEGGNSRRGKAEIKNNSRANDRDGPIAKAMEAASASDSSIYPNSMPNDGAETNTNNSEGDSAWSTLSHRLFTDNVPEATISTQREPSSFTKEYDKLARKHGLQPFPAGHMADSSSASVSSISVKRDMERTFTGADSNSPIGKGARILNRLLKRTESTKDISERSRRTLGHPLGQKRMSVSDLAGMGRSGRTDHLKGLHLEDMVRLNGVCEFKLPEQMSPGKLLVPACFHAAAQYLLANGLTQPSLFRVAGRTEATEALYDYYQRQLNNSNREAILRSTSLATLPTHLKYTVNDVAHLFKALLAGLPGGLLGSPAVFQALHSIQSYLHPDPSLEPRIAKKIRPRMIALAVASLNLHFRITLICAVFGLLRCVALSTHGVIEESKITKHAETFTYLKEDSLGVIFGPLLLGDKSDQILLPAHEERGGLLVLPTITHPNETPTKGKFKQKRNSEDVHLQREKARRAALVTEMIIAEWENVVQEMKKIGALETTRKQYDIPDLENRTDSEIDIEAAHQQPERSPEKTKREAKLKPGKFENPLREGDKKDGPNPPRSRDSAKKRHYIQLRNSKSVRYMKDNLQRTHSKAGDSLRFPSGKYKHAPTAIEMMTALLPTPLIGEQDVDLIETDQVDISTGETFHSKEAAGAIEENTLVNFMEASNAWGEIESPRNQRSENNAITGHVPDVSSSTNKSPETSISSPINSLTTEMPKDDPSLRPLLEVESDKPTLLEAAEVAPSPEMTASKASISDSDTADVPESFSIEDHVSSMNLKSGNMAQQELDKSRQVNSPPPRSPTPKLTLTTPSGNGIDISKEGEGTGAQEDEIALPEPLSGVPSSLGLVEGDVWATPPLGEMTPKAIMTKELPVTSGAEELEELVASAEEDRDIDLEDIHSFTTSPSLPPSSLSDPPVLGISQRSASHRSVSAPYLHPPLSPPLLTPRAPNVLPLEIRSNSALYSEIRRLKGLLEKKTEEADRVAKELEVTRRMVSAESVGTLGQLLRDSKEEVRVWRNRAEWAEAKVKELVVEKSTASASKGIFRDGQLDGHSSRPEKVAWRGDGISSGITIGRGGGRGRTMGRAVAQRIGSWGVGLEGKELDTGMSGGGDRLEPFTSIEEVQERRRGSGNETTQAHILTVGPQGPLLRSPPPLPSHPLPTQLPGVGRNRGERKVYSPAWS